MKKIIFSISDLGVIRNNGRSGARYSKIVLSNLLKKCNYETNVNFDKQIIETPNEYNKTDFNNAQDIESDYILKNLEINKTMHIGGGHDHAYPFLKAIYNKYKSTFDGIFILNIDPHFDTRINKIRNSGTPFRDFSNFLSNKKNFNLTILEFGTHKLSNSTTTKEKLKYGTLNEMNFNDIPPINDLNHFLKKLKNSYPNYIFFISLDCDSINSSTMSAVSAVNHLGFSDFYINELFSISSKIFENYFFGIYEYNPTFEDLSIKGGKFLTYLIFNYLT